MAAQHGEGIIGSSPTWWAGGPWAMVPGDEPPPWPWLWASCVGPPSGQGGAWPSGSFLQQRH